MEGTGSGAAELIDLDRFKSDLKRQVWRDAAPALLPGLAVHLEPGCAPDGHLAHVALGLGDLWAIRSSPAVAEYRAPPRIQDRPGRISLCVQVAGSVAVSQGACQFRMVQGDICIIDEDRDFELQSGSLSSLALLQCPRPWLIRRIPWLPRHISTLIPGDVPGVAILGDLLISTLRTAAVVPVARRATLLSAAVQVLLAVLVNEEKSSIGRRSAVVATALSHIDVNFQLATLKSTLVAECVGLSRRRLDQLMVQATGISVSAQIARRRLESAAAQLVDPAHSSESVTDIAIGNGFQDSTHFSRTFKKQFGQSPSAWRRQRLPMTLGVVKSA